MQSKAIGRCGHKNAFRAAIEQRPSKRSAVNNISIVCGKIAACKWADWPATCRMKFNKSGRLIACVAAAHSMEAPADISTIQQNCCQRWKNVRLELCDQALAGHPTIQRRITRPEQILTCGWCCYHVILINILWHIKIDLCIKV